MAQKAKKKRNPELTDKKQSERFKETARELGVDNEESAQAFERAFKKLVPERPPKRRD